MIKKTAVTLGLLSGVVGAIPAIAQNAGFIIFGNTRDIAMDYCLDNGSSGQFDSYYLQVRTQKFKYAEVIVTYPDHFNADLRGSKVELFNSVECRGGRPIPLESVKIDPEARRITVVPKEPIPANTPVRLVISNVRNPNLGGMYQVDARLLRADVPAPVYIGSWIMSFD